MRRILLLISIPGLILITSLAGCLDLPSDVIMPTWDVELNVPLLKKTYTLDEIIKTQDYVSVDGEGNYIVTSDAYEQKTGVSNFISVSVLASTQGNTVASGGSGINVYLAFPEDAKIDEAIFREGKISLSARNSSLTESITLNLRFPGIKDPNNNVVVLNLPLAPGGFDSVQVDLINHKYKEPSDQLFFTKGQIWIQATATSNSILPTLATFSVFSSDFVFKQATGSLPKKSLGVEKNTFSLNVGEISDFRDKILLSGATLHLEASYESPTSNPFEFEVKNLTVTGISATGERKILRVNGNPSVSLRFRQGDLSYDYTEQNSTITEFISFLPDSIEIAAEYIMNPDNSNAYRTATSSDSVEFKVSFTSKLTSGASSRLAIKSSSIKERSELEFNEDDRKQIRNGKYADITIDIENALPLSSSLKITILDASFSPLFVLTKEGSGNETLGFTSGTIDASTGKVTGAVTTKSRIKLNEEQIEKLSRGYHAELEVTVNTEGADASTNPVKVALRKSDWLKISTYGSLSYTIKPEEN
jgi:hypothetical protein